jgi:DNA polymerase III subunit beta
MHITTSREDHLAAIAPLMSVAQRGTKFRTGHASLTIRAGEGTKIHFNTSDDNSDVCTSSTATIRERGEIGVSAKRLSDIMRSFDSGSTVEMQRKGNFLNIKLGGSRFSINCDGPLAPVTRQAGKTDQTTGDFTLAADEFKYLLEAACSGVAGLGPDSKLPQRRAVPPDRRAPAPRGHRWRTHGCGQRQRQHAASHQARAGPQRGR